MSFVDKHGVIFAPSPGVRRQPLSASMGRNATSLLTAAGGAGIAAWAPRGRGDPPVISPLLKVPLPSTVSGSAFKPCSARPTARCHAHCTSIPHAGKSPLGWC
ncbi:hypothetical protein AAFF_G00130180 [Aldrovandia affinis]|uniref:Uncharacterized protein n=1 Tax=Aldrovandia affinis TaxID=143900 RepID=A0AAD7W9V5_9TELE|nr:hypothetical protein AAFF_G00130180 [Aldrovandia affinis]